MKFKNYGFNKYIKQYIYMQPTYPTEWSRGKPRGSIGEEKTGYKVRLAPPGTKQTYEFFDFNEKEDKQTTFRKAKEFRDAESARLGLTRNQIRYTDANTIEIKLKNGFIMKTDANLLNIVEKYPLNVKLKKDDTKKEDSILRNYVTYKIKKGPAIQFTKLICNYKKVYYINSDTMDLRLENLKEFGAIDPDSIFLTVNQNVDKQGLDTENSYKYFNMEINDLPKNIWLLGKPAGTVFKRTGDNKYSGNVQDEFRIGHTKTFKISDYNSEDEAYQAGIKWQIETSYAFGVTGNLIKILDNNTILVKLTNGYIMKTDKIFIPLIQKISLCSTESGSKSKNKNTYAYASFLGVNDQFHNLITGFDMVDHINGDTLNNCLENLRNVDHYLNNKNRHYIDLDYNINGISIMNIETNKYYTATIKIEDIEYIRGFSIKKYGEKLGKELAVKFMERFYAGKKFESFVNQKDTPELMEIELAKLEYVLKLAKDSFMNDKIKYIIKLTKDDIAQAKRENLIKRGISEDEANKRYPKNLGILEDDLNKIHDYYITHQKNYISWLVSEHKMISTFLNNKV